MKFQRGGGQEKIMAKDKTLPSELRIIRTSDKTIDVTEKIKSRVPQADWLENPDSWNASRFIKETSDFMYEIYGINADQDKHLLALLADQISIYIEAKKGIARDGVVAEFNAGKTMGASPYFAVMKEALSKIIALMNELGLTPKGRMGKTSTNTTSYDDLLGGVQVKK
jgi:P27 family predicted phage terminase small subunit